jgi:predicted ATPase
VGWLRRTLDYCVETRGQTLKVKAIRLQNFMGFKDTGWIELRPITLLFGRNSSGKSAIIRAILLLRQSLRTNNHQPLEFNAHNGADLGSFERMIRGRKTVEDSGQLRRMTFGFRCEIGEDPLADPLRDIRPPELTGDHANCAELSLSFQWSVARQEVELAGILLNTAFGVRADSPKKRTILHADYLGDEDGQPDWFLSSNFYDLSFPSQQFPWPEDPTWIPSLQIVRFVDWASDGTRRLDRPTANKNQDSFLPILRAANRGDDIRASEQAGDALGATGDQASRDATEVLNIFIACSNAIREWLGEGAIRHLGPIRFAPRRAYLFRDLSRHEWDETGQRAILDFALMKLAQDDPNLQREITPRQRTSVDDWFERLELGKKLRVDPIKSFASEPAEGFRIELYEGGDQPDFNLRDVGYGASQVFPVVLQASFAPPNAFLIIEQPELHLHPEAQAKLADLFIESVNETRDDKGRTSRFYLLETHSETLFLRLRVELARTAAGTAEGFSIKPGDFVCYYIERDRKTGTSEAAKMTFDLDGEFVERPARFFDFFGQDFKETMDLKKARSSKGK